MSEIKEEIIKEKKREEEDLKEMREAEVFEKQKAQSSIIDEGRRAERLKANPDFKWLMARIVNRGQEISDIQNARLANIVKLTKGEKGTIDNIVAHSMQESVLGGEFLGLKNIKFWIDSAIIEKDEILKNLKEEKEDEEE